MTAVPKWQAGHLYLPGDLVQPLQAGASAAAALVNPSFDDGDTGWTKGAGFSIVTGESYDGTYAAKYQAAPGTNAFVEQIASIPITPGESVSATCMVNQGASSANDAGGSVWIRWYDASDVLLSGTQGSVVKSGSDGAYYQSSVTGTAPAGAAAFRIAGECYLLGSGQALWLDRFTLSYAPKSAPEGLIYKAVQPEPGTSANAEPAWPTTLGVQVIDNTVTWEAVYASRVTWQASPALQSGTTEPTWPTEPGAFVSDGTISWECITRRVEDEKCPNSREVVIIASKVFAADGDIVRFSATANPLDWSSENDAGYLPTGLQSANSNDVKVLAQYRGNLVGFNASSFQNWQVDPDPQNMANLDQMEGIGSTWNKAAQPVANDLFYLSQLGVRSVGIAAGTNNLAAGDIGMPIDVLVRAKLASPPVRDGLKPLATYYPGAGQYWLAFRDCGTPTITGNLPDGTVGDVVDYQYTVTPAYPGQTVTLTLTGALPTGLSMDASGHVTGTLTASGTFSWTITPSSDCGDGAALADSADVALVEFWMTAQRAAAGDDELWVSTDAASWPTATTRTPFIEDATYGPAGVGVGAAVIGTAGAGGMERITTFDYATPLPTASIATTISLRQIRLIDGIAFAVYTNAKPILYTADKGATWATAYTPTGGGSPDIARVGSRWITTDKGGTSYFYYTDQAVPNGGWTRGASFGSGYDNFACNGDVAVAFDNTTKFRRTTDGIAWAETNLGASHEVSGGAGDAIAIGDVFVFSMAAAGGTTRIKRSTDAGLTFNTVTVDAAALGQVTRFAYANGILVASVGTKVYRSLDTGATWAASTLPIGGSAFHVGVIQRVP